MVFKKWNAPGHVILGKCDEARREAESLLSPRNGLFSNSNMAQRLANHSHIYWRYCVTEFAYCDLIGLYVFMMQQHLITYSVLAPITCFIYFRLTLRHSRDERCLHVLHRWCSYPFPTIVKKMYITQLRDVTQCPWLNTWSLKVSVQKNITTHQLSKLLNDNTMIKVKAMNEFETRVSRWLLKSQLEQIVHALLLVQEPVLFMTTTIWGEPKCDLNERFIYRSVVN